jgi:Tol biopolymer transport system component
VSAAYVTAAEALNTLPVVAAPPLPAQGGERPEGQTPVERTAAVATPPPQPAGGGLRGKLVLQGAFGGAIYLYDFATGALRQLTTGYDPTLSPDGSQVAFTRVGGEHGLYVINADGTGERRIFSEREGFWSPKWSPDGRYILFVRSDSGWKCKDYSTRFGTYNCHSDEPGDGDLPYMWEIRPHLSRVDTNGGNYLDLATLHSASSPDWNSAGVVYASEAGIQITSDDGQDHNRKVYFDNLQQYYQDPDWQPGGGRIVLQQRRAGHWEVFAVNPDGSGFTALTRPATALVDTMPSNVAPAWSPDGRHIVFLSNRTPSNEAGPWSFWVMDADGSNQRRLPIDLPIDYTYVEEQMVDWGP